MRHRLLRLVRPPVGSARTEVARRIERHAEAVVDWLVDLIQAYQDPTATDRELTDFCEEACTALEARVAALRADLSGADR